MFLGPLHGKRIIAQDLERFKRIEASVRPAFADAMRTKADILAALARGEENSIYKLIGLSIPAIVREKEG